MTAGSIFFLSFVAAIFGSWGLVAAGKGVGDQLAAWVIANEEEDDAPAPDFGVEETHSNDVGSLSAYRYYAKRYRKIRRARREDVTLARRFDLIYWGQYLLWALIVVELVVLWQMGEIE